MTALATISDTIASILPVAAVMGLSIKQLLGLALGIPSTLAIGMWLFTEIGKFREAQNSDKRKEALVWILVGIVAILILGGFLTWLGIDIGLSLNGIDQLKTDVGS